MEQRDVVIIGAGPAGLSAAIFTQLDGWSTLVFESNWAGGQGAIAYTVTNYPGFLPGDGALLMDNMKEQVTLAPPAGVGAELRYEKVLSINAEEKIVATEANQYKAKAIIMAMGSTMQRLGVSGEEEFVGKGVSYYAKRDYKEFADKRVLVVGGGNSTAKSALAAKYEGKASDVILVHRRDSLRAYSPMVKLLQNKGIKIWYNREVMEIKGDNKVSSAVVMNNKTGEEKEIAVDWIIICIGTEPDTKLAREAGIKMTGKFVKVDDQMRTGKVGIFACGEITPGYRHLINAASEGACAGMAASGYLALEKVKRGEIFEGAKNGKYADEYLEMLK